VDIYDFIQMIEMVDLWEYLQQLGNIVKNLNTKLTEKGKEINEYKDKHPNSMVVGGGGGGGSGVPEKILEEEEPTEEPIKEKSNTTGILTGSTT
jgi:hypothetical protein